MLLWVSKKIKILGAAVAAVFLVLGAAFLKGRSTGVRKEQTKSLKKEVAREKAVNETVKKTQQVEVDISGAPSSDVRQRLQDHWTRD